MSKKASFGKKAYKYFIGSRNNEKVARVHITLGWSIKLYKKANWIKQKKHKNVEKKSVFLFLYL